MHDEELAGFDLHYPLRSNGVAWQAVEDCVELVTADGAVDRYYVGLELVEQACALPYLEHGTTYAQAHKAGGRMRRVGKQHGGVRYELVHASTYFVDLRFVDKIAFAQQYDIRRFHLRSYRVGDNRRFIFGFEELVEVDKHDDAVELKTWRPGHARCCARVGDAAELDDDELYARLDVWWAENA